MPGYGDSATWPRHPINQHFDPREPEPPQDDDEIDDDDEDQSW
jgi:hypothetical protein